MSQQASIEVRDQGGITIIGFPAEHRVLSRPAIENLGEEFSKVIETSKNLRFIVSFEGVEYLSSTVLGTLVASLLKIQGRGGELRVAAVNEDLDLLFRLTGLHKIFQITESLDEAIKSLG